MVERNVFGVFYISIHSHIYRHEKRGNGQKKIRYSLKCLVGPIIISGWAHHFDLKQYLTNLRLAFKPKTTYAITLHLVFNPNKHIVSNKRQ